MFTQAAIMMSVLTLSQGWGLALWPMRGLHCARVDQSAARRNKWEKLTVQGKLIGTDTQILSVCVCVWYCFTGFQYPLKPKIKKYTFSDRSHILKPISKYQMTWNSFIMWPDVAGKLDEANIWFPPVSVRWSAQGNFAEYFAAWSPGWPLFLFRGNSSLCTGRRWQKIEIKLRLYTILRLCKNKSKYCNNIWLRQTAWLHQKSIPAGAGGMFGR